MEQPLNILFGANKQTTESVVGVVATEPKAKVGLSLFDSILNQLTPKQEITTQINTATTVIAGQIIKEVPTINIQQEISDINTQVVPSLVPEKSLSLDNIELIPAITLAIDIQENVSLPKSESSIVDEKLSKSYNKINNNPSNETVVKQGNNPTNVSELTSKTTNNNSFLNKIVLDNNTKSTPTKLEKNAIPVTENIIPKEEITQIDATNIIIKDQTIPSNTPCNIPIKDIEVPIVMNKTTSTITQNTNLSNVEDIAKQPITQIQTKEVKNDDEPKIKKVSLFDSIKSEIVVTAKNEPIITKSTMKAPTVLEPLIQQVETISNEATILPPITIAAQEQQTQVAVDTPLADKSIQIIEPTQRNIPLNDTKTKDIVNTTNQIIQTVPILENTQILLETTQTNTPKAVILNEQIINNDTQDSSIEKPKESLFDKLSASSKQSVVKVQSENISQIIEKNTETKTTQEYTQKETFLNSMYLGSQKIAGHVASAILQTEANKVFQNGQTTIANIKKGAQILNLGLESIHEVKMENQAIQKDTIISTINDKHLSHVAARVIFLDTEIVKNMDLNEAQLRTVQTGISQNIVQIQVQDSNVNTFESKIVGAKQQMNMLMSDVAKAVYDNYKPPINAFRISLNPGALGQIAIVLKNNSASNLDVGMSMTNSATLEAFIDNQTILKNSIAKNFGENTSINLNFSLNNDTQLSSDFGSFSQNSGNNKQHSSNFGNTNNKKIVINEEMAQDSEKSYM